MPEGSERTATRLARCASQISALAGFYSTTIHFAVHRGQQLPSRSLRQILGGNSGVQQ